MSHIEYIMTPDWQRRKIVELQNTVAFKDVPLFEDMLSMHCTIDIWKAVGRDRDVFLEPHQVPDKLNEYYQEYRVALIGSLDTFVDKCMMPLHQFQSEAANIGWLRGYEIALEKLELSGIRFDPAIVFEFDLPYAADCPEWVILNHKLMTAHENGDEMTLHSYPISSGASSVISHSSAKSTHSYAKSTHSSSTSGLSIPFSGWFGFGSDVVKQLEMKLEKDKENWQQEFDDDKTIIDDDKTVADDFEELDEEAEELEELDEDLLAHIISGDSGWQTADKIAGHPSQIRLKELYPEENMEHVSKSLDEVLDLVEKDTTGVSSQQFYGIIFYASSTPMKERMDVMKIPYQDLSLARQKKNCWTGVVKAFNEMQASKYGILLIEGQFIDALHEIPLNLIQYIRVHDVPMRFDFVHELMHLVKSKRRQGLQLYIELVANLTMFEPGQNLQSFCLENGLDFPAGGHNQHWDLPKQKKPHEYPSGIPMRVAIKKIIKKKSEEYGAVGKKQPHFYKSKTINYFTKKNHEYALGKEPYCNACQKRGHYTRYCPVGGSVRGLKQGIPNQKGHKTGGEFSRCFCCYLYLGHNSTQCVYRHPRSFRAPYLCWNCASPVHNQNDCPFPRYQPPAELGPLIPPGECRAIVNGRLLPIGEQWPWVRIAQEERRRKGLPPQCGLDF